jgi:hypothetical protein
MMTIAQNPDWERRQTADRKIQRFGRVHRLALTQEADEIDGPAFAIAESPVHAWPADAAAPFDATDELVPTSSVPEEVERRGGGAGRVRLDDVLDAIDEDSQVVLVLHVGDDSDYGQRYVGVADLDQ